jgi:hypothetical protein
MPDATALVEEILASAKDALARGFKILACKPNGKDPWPTYSPHAVNDCTSNPETALKPWKDGTTANYGIGCGHSNICVVDCDKGLTTLEEFEKWRIKNQLPETLTVKSGREGLGIHLYYTGAVPTTGFDIDGITGELKSLGGYVVGFGSIHPSGKKYEIIHDLPLAPLPELLKGYAKEKGKYNFPEAGSKNLIPISTRWRHIQQRAGEFKSLGLRNEEALFNALKDWTADNCEDGENYPEDKIREIAAWAATDDCEENRSIKATIGSPDPIEDSVGIPEISLDTISGDAVGDLALGMTDGTFIPPCFVRTAIKTLVGAVLDGSIAFPGEETLHMRHWSAIISSRPEAGKSEAWKRVMMLMKAKFCTYEGNPGDNQGVLLPVSGFFSSGEHALRTLAENDNHKHLAYFDEMKGLFTKGGSLGSTLFDKLLELYEKTDGGAGSVTHGKASFNNVSLSMLGNFTRNSWDTTTAGKGVAGSGFLSRMTLTYSNGVDYQGDWSLMDPTIVNPAMTFIIERCKWLRSTSSLVVVETGFPFVPKEDTDAKTERLKFQKWLHDEKKIIEKNEPDSALCMRLEAHFKRDLLIRAAFTAGELEDIHITKEMVIKSVLWAKHELMLRTTLWPVDGGNDVHQCERKIISAIRKKGPLTKSGVQKYSNADKTSGGFEIWNRAWKALLMAERVIHMPQKSDRGRDKFGFQDAVWSKPKQEWFFG